MTVVRGGGTQGNPGDRLRGNTRTAGIQPPIESLAYPA
jgi:hypothetical protein